MDELTDFLRKLLAEDGAEIVDRGTDWVIENAVDLRGARPREETRRLVASVVEFNRELINGSPAGPTKREAFIDFVTSYRAAFEFSVSTLLRGFLSFRQGLMRVLVAQGVEQGKTLVALELMDDLYFESIFEMADEYMNKLKDIIEERQNQLRERDLQVARLERHMAVLSRR